MVQLIDLLDVWGTSDGSTIWASGFSNDNLHSVLLKSDGRTWQTVWSRGGQSQVMPYGYFVTSVWGDKSLFAGTGRGVFHDTTRATTLPWFPYRIRGSGNNNIAAVGDNGMIWHFNGSSWKEVSSKPSQTFYSVAVSGDLVVAVGVDHSIGFGLGVGVIQIGKH